LILNSFSFGGVLFLVAAGLSLIFGLMRIPNLLHGSLFVLGGYVSIALGSYGLTFWQSALATAVFGGVLGMLLERCLLRRLNGRAMPQVLLTLGVSLIVADLSLAMWGGDPIQPRAPTELAGSVELLGQLFPAYRLALIFVAVMVAAALWLLIDHTLLGARLRASVDDVEMAGTIGIPVERLFTLVFGLGAAMATFGGAMSAPYLSVYPGLDAEVLSLALIVVTVGGAGSLLGVAAGSLVVGFIYNFGQIAFPELASVVLFLPMLFMLIVRPQGLLGKAEAGSETR
jgi:branched-chain amino acid transport system permease protein